MRKTPGFGDSQPRDSHRALQSVGRGVVQRSRDVQLGFVRNMEATDAGYQGGDRLLKKRIEGEELQRLMEEQDLTQRELAEKAGVISLARRGRQPMSVESERKVAQALGVESQELVDQSGSGLDSGETNSVSLKGVMDSP